jgi:hypothetical protein
VSCAPSAITAANVHTFAIRLRRADESAFAQDGAPTSVEQLANRDDQHHDGQHDG